MIAHVRSLAAAFVRAVAPVDTPPELADRLLIDQASDTAYIMRGITAVGASTICLMVFEYFGTRGYDYQLLLFCLLLADYGLIVWHGVIWLGRDKPSGADAWTFIKQVRGMVFVLGVLWAMLLIWSMRHANGDQRSLLYGIIVGCLTTPLLVRPSSCALAFYVPLTIGAMISMFVWKTVDPFAVNCLSGFIALTSFGIVYLNNRLTERAISAIRVEENGKLIKLLLRDFEESASDWLWETNARMELQPVSARLAQVVHKRPEEVRGVFPQALLGDIARFEHRVGSPVYRLNKFIAEQSPFRDLVVQVVIDGEERSWSLTGKPILNKAGEFAGYHGVGSDITAQRRSQEQIAFLARHDSLTKLPNRVLFNEVLHHACARCNEEGVALLCLDLDDFKLVNDTYGHATGDGLLIAVGERIRGCLREGDIAARLGGDEFAIILVTNDVEEASAIARRIIERVNRPYHFDGQIVTIGISVGISMAPQDNSTPNGLMKNADLALYRAKADGRGVWRFYDSDMDERLQDRRSLQLDLRHALGRGELFLEYQPIVSLPTGRIVSTEALLRWRHPERGLLSPAQFVQMAEETGLIGVIGGWVLAEACRTAASWPMPLRVAVNLSPLQFRDANLVEMVDEVLLRTGLPPERLELEITENTMLETNSQTVDALWKLHGRGVRIALDDFGTGYSSLSYLRRFPFDTIKIDRSFIRDLGYEKDDSSIVIAIIGLAENMNMSVTAEGVETREQETLLASYGCGQAQGFLFYPPLSAGEIVRVIGAGPALPAEVPARDMA